LFRTAAIDGQSKVIAIGSAIAMLLIDKDALPEFARVTA